MSHVRADKVAGGKGCAETEFTGEDGGGHDTGEASGVVTGAGWVSATDTEEVKHGSLSLEDGAAADSADFYRRHRDADV